MKDSKDKRKGIRGTKGGNKSKQVEESKNLNHSKTQEGNAKGSRGKTAVKQPVNVSATFSEDEDVVQIEVDNLEKEFPNDEENSDEEEIMEESVQKSHIESDPRSKTP